VMSAELQEKCCRSKELKEVVINELVKRTVLDTKPVISFWSQINSSKMRLLVIPFFLSLLLVSITAKPRAKVYKIILKTGVVPGYTDSNEIRKLNEPYKGLLALYSAIGGTNCDGDIAN
jgi:hypothetical protein